MKMPTVDETLDRLKKSTFRAKFHLTDKDKAYITDKGIENIGHGILTRKKEMLPVLFHFNNVYKARNLLKEQSFLFCKYQVNVKFFGVKGIYK